MGNLFEAERYRNPYPYLERVRADDPVAHHRIYNQWAITGYDEAMAVLSSKDFMVNEQIQTLMTVSPYTRLEPHAKQLMLDLLVFQDPPDHTRLRRLISKAFTPMQIARLEPKMHGLARQLIADAAEQSELDIYEAYTSTFPIKIIAELLGIPEDRHVWLHRISDSIVRILDPFQAFDVAEINADIAEMFEFFSTLFDERLADPRDDLLTALVQAEEEGDRLTRRELLAMVSLLMLAGHETTSSQLGNSILALSEYPDQRKLLRERPELLSNAVEELIRYDTSVQSMPRIAVADATIGGRAINSGDFVLLMLGACTRDPRRFDSPNELQIDRHDPRPISFGHGIHHCIGAALARLELKVGLDAFLERFPDYTVDPSAVEWKQSITLRGPTKLPVKVVNGVRHR